MYKRVQLDKYAYMTQYDRRKLHRPGLITWEIKQRGGNVCVSHKMFAHQQSDINRVISTEGS